VALASTPSMDLFIPAVSNVNGANNTFWTSDVRIYNPNSSDVVVTLTYTPMVALGGTVQTYNYTVPAMTIQTLTNVLDSVFGLSQTAGSLHMTAPANIEAESRTWTPGTVGTYGQRIPAIPAFQALTAGNSADLLYIDNSDAFRTNLGVMDATGAGSTAHLQAYDGYGNAAGNSYPLTLGAYELKQIGGVLAALGVGQGTNYRVVVTADTGSVISYASQVDNASGDPIYVDGSIAHQGGGGSNCMNTGIYIGYDSCTTGSLGSSMLLNFPLWVDVRDSALYGFEEMAWEYVGTKYYWLILNDSDPNLNYYFDTPIDLTQYEAAPFTMSFTIIGHDNSTPPVACNQAAITLTGQYDGCGYLTGTMEALVTYLGSCPSASAADFKDSIGKFDWNWEAGIGTPTSKAFMKMVPVLQKSLKQPVR